jgi:ABC-type uncharacterized transport system ATPase subunit
MRTALEAHGIVRRYGALVANDGIDLALAAGEIHAVMGENGAGKSTLMSILFGMQRPDAGTILLDGKAVHLRSPADAISRGLFMVHQAFRLFDALSVWENVVYGQEPRRGPLLDRQAARARVAALAARYGLAVDPDARLGLLAVGVRQRVEILKALYRRARILILDEPTAVLTPPEREGLFAVMRRLAAEGCSVLFVTHKLDEVLAISDRVTVLRDGRVTARFTTRETTPAAIAQAMIGRTLPSPPPRPAVAPGKVLLDVQALTVRAPGRPKLVDDVSFSVRAGEIVGIAGVAGNGQEALVAALVGLHRPDAGRVVLDGHDVTGADVAAHRAAGLAYIPEDRAAVGSAAAASLADNLAMGFHRARPLARGTWQDRRAVRAAARALVSRHDIRAGSVDDPAGALSGGNLQKLVVARELAHRAPVLIAEQPTRGVDLGAIESIHALLAAERATGRAVLLVSAELSEILALSDRVLVMFEGRVLAELPAAAADVQHLGLLIAGRRDAAA